MIGGDDLDFEGAFDLSAILAEVARAWPEAVKQFLDDPEQRIRPPLEATPSENWASGGVCLFRNLEKLQLCDKVGVTEEVDDSLIVIYPGATGVSFTFAPRPSETYDLVMRVMARFNAVPLKWALGPEPSAPT